jgi:hypothetical protein
MGTRRSENRRREDRSPGGGGGAEEARRGILSLGSGDWETSEVCTTPCTTTSVPAAGKLRRASGSGAGWEGSGGVAGRSITLNASELWVVCGGVVSGSMETVGRGAGSWLRVRGPRGGDKDEADEEEEDMSVGVL